MDNTKIQSLAVIFGLWLLISAPSLVHAIDKNQQKSRIAVGGYTLVNNDATISLTDANVGAGVSIDPEDALGVDSKQTVFRLDGHFRFNNIHRITYSWYRVSSDGSKVLDEEIEWEDEDGNAIVIPAGARVDTLLKYDIFKVGYLWSFYHSEKVELSGGAGLHTTRFKVGLQAETTSSGGDATEVALTVPLPVLSIALTYSVTPKFSWAFKSEAFALAYQDWEGSYIDTVLAMEYRVAKNVGLGIGLANNTLKLKEENDDYKFNYENRITGVDLYVATYF